MLHALLAQSIGQAATRSAVVINIALHGNHPAKPFAHDLGFRPVGMPSQATGAPGLAQQRYQLDLRKD